MFVTAREHTIHANDRVVEGNPACTVRDDLVLAISFFADLCTMYLRVGENDASKVRITCACMCHLPH